MDWFRSVLDFKDPIISTVVTRIGTANIANIVSILPLPERYCGFSTGYARGKLFDEAKTLPRDRKDWYDLGRVSADAIVLVCLRVS